MALLEAMFSPTKEYTYPAARTLVSKVELFDPVWLKKLVQQERSHLLNATTLLHEAMEVVIKIRAAPSLNRLLDSLSSVLMIDQRLYRVSQLFDPIVLCSLIISVFVVLLPTRPEPERRCSPTGQ